MRNIHFAIVQLPLVAFSHLEKFSGFIIKSNRSTLFLCGWLQIKLPLVPLFSDKSNPHFQIKQINSLFNYLYLGHIVNSRDEQQKQSRCDAGEE